MTPYDFRVRGPGTGSERSSLRLLIPSVLFVALGCAGSPGKPDTTIRSAAPCGPEYPADFPCIPGGQPLPLVQVRIVPIRTLANIQYRLPADQLSRRLNAAATDAGWRIASAEVGTEPDGDRYRASFTLDRQLSTSIVPTAQGSILLVTELKDR